ncbi:hypothetical protein [Eikenella corrodens]|uniref:hypothetical protein n=1 Tax=Eikenella corrodens TaxID=539 RepID=UPI00129A7C5E|nr:hypothetical protein [Eikenella corrodens]
MLTGGADGALASGSTALAAPYLNEISGKLDGGGKVLFDALSGAAIGLATGGNTGAMAAGANTDWNNRQLHDHEISKIKRIAGEFAAKNNISLQEAETRLLVEAMRQVDRTYANQHAKADGAAAQFLRYHTDSFNTETGERITEFASSGYYDDSRKFAEQAGYMTERLVIRNFPTSQPIRGTSYLRISSDDINAMGRGLTGRDLPKERSNIRGYVRGATKSVLGDAWHMQGTGAEYEMPVGVFHDNQYERKDRFELTSRQEAQGALGFTVASFIVPIAVGKGAPLLRSSRAGAWLAEARMPRVSFGRFGKTANLHEIPHNPEVLLPNLYPGDPVVAQNTIRRLVQDSTGRYWLESGTGRLITPSGNYDFITNRTGHILVTRPNSHVHFSTHLGLSNGQPVKYAGRIRFFNNNARNRGSIIYWDGGSGHYKPANHLAPNAGLPINLYRDR